MMVRIAISSILMNLWLLMNVKKDSDGDIGYVMRRKLPYDQARNK